MLNELRIARGRFQLEHTVERRRLEDKLADDITTRLLSKVYIDYFSVYCKESFPIINWEQTFKRLRDVDYRVDLLAWRYDRTFVTSALCIGSYISDNRHGSTRIIVTNFQPYESIQFLELFRRALEYAKVSLSTQSTSTAFILFLLHQVMSLLRHRLRWRKNNKHLTWWDENLEKMYSMKYREISGNLKKNGIKSLKEFIVYFALASVIPARNNTDISSHEIEVFHNHLGSKIPKGYECLEEVLKTIPFLQEIRSYAIRYFRGTTLKLQDLHQVIEPYFASLHELNNRIRNLGQELRQSKMHDSIRNYAPSVLLIIQKANLDLASIPNTYIGRRFKAENIVSLAEQEYLSNLKKELSIRTIHALLSYCEYCRSADLLISQFRYLIPSMGISLEYQYCATLAIWTPSYENGGPSEYTSDLKLQTCEELFITLEVLEGFDASRTVWLGLLKYFIYSISSIYPQSHDASNATNAISIILHNAINVLSELETTLCFDMDVETTYLHVAVEKLHFLQLMLNDIANYFVEHFSKTVGLENLLKEEVLDEFETFWMIISLFQQHVAYFEDNNTKNIIHGYCYSDIYVTSCTAILLCVGRLSRWISIISLDSNDTISRTWLLKLQQISTEHVLSAMLEYIKNPSQSAYQHDTFILASGDFEYLAQIAIDTPIAENGGPAMYTRNVKLTLCKGLIPIVVKMIHSSIWYATWLEKINNQISELDLQDNMMIVPFFRI